MLLVVVNLCPYYIKGFRMKNIRVLTLSLTVGLLASATLYGTAEAADGAPTGDNACQAALSPMSESECCELALKRRSTLNDLKTFMMSLERKNLSMEKLIVAMNFLLASKNQQEMTQEESLECIRLCKILKTIIAYNMLKLERAKEDIKIQQEFTTFIKDNLDDFLLISSEVGKVMAARYE